jgi:hypothetical protein
MERTSGNGDRAAMYGANKLKPGLFGANCASGYLDALPDFCGEVSPRLARLGLRRDFEPSGRRKANKVKAR